MRTAEQKIQAVIKFREDHANTGRRPKALAFRDDDQVAVIPRHGPRGRGRLAAAFSAHLAKRALPGFFLQDEAAGSTGMPVILDTNVVVGGLFSLRTGSPSRRLMELALADGGEIVPCVTNAIIYEYRRALEMFGDDRLEQLYRLLSKSIVIPILPDIEVPPVKADPADTPFVQALILTMKGLEGNQRPPSRLVTKDYHLINMAIATNSAEWLRGRIVTPRDVLRELHR